MKRVALITLLSLPVAGWAQEPMTRSDADQREAVLVALDLPTRAQRLRDDGVPSDQVAKALEASRLRGVPASETSETLDRAHDDIRSHGPVDNFGAFVQARLDEGLRGQDLAAAIHAEHEAHGKGKPDHAGPPDDDHGRPDDGHGKPDHAGKPDHDDDDDDDDDDDGRPSGTDPGGRPTGTGHGKPTTPGGGR